MRRIKKYIAVFLKVGTFSAILFGLLMSLKIGLWSGVIAGIMFGVSICAIIAIIFLPIDYFLTKKLPHEALNVRQDREIQVKGNFDYVFQKCIDILKSFKIIKIVTPIKEKNSISARTKLSLFSFGEDIKLQFEILDQDISKIHIGSRPTYKYTLLDYGKNYKNVELINKAIADHFGKRE